MEVLGRQRPSTAFVGVVFVLLIWVAAFLPAAESDLSTTVIAPEEARLGEVLPITVGYANDGPDSAGSAHIDVYIPSGVPARLDELTQEQRQAIQASAEGTDTLGNEALLFDDERYCESVYMQLQRMDGDDDANSVEGLDPGVSASFGFELPIPMEPPRFGRVTIIEPAPLAQSWRSAVTEQDRLDAAIRNLYLPGICEKLVGDPDESVCNHVFDNCFGERISLMDPVETEFELVDDGADEPTLGCRVLEGFTPGNIAVIRRGRCEFDVKGFNAEQAGAVAAVIINHDGCRDQPDSDQCVIDMYQGLGPLISIPVVMLAKADGEPILAVLEANTTVRGIIGPQEDDLFLDSFAFLTDEDDLDPNPSNDQDRAEIAVIPEELTPPVASFSYSPEQPTIGSAIQFIDTSTLGPPTTWAWDFGDGIGASTEQNPTYTYTDSGSYTVTLTVANSVGSDTAEHDLNLCCGGPLAFRYLVPAAAYAPGVEGAFFQTDLEVNNTENATVRYAFEWHPRGIDNSSPLVSETFTLGVGMGARYTNIVSEVFELDPGALGALGIVSDSPYLIGLSRTYNLGSDGHGTFGQAVPAIPTNEMIPSGLRRRIIFMTESDDYRSNLGCQNGTDESLRIMIELFDHEGASLETRHLDLPARSNDQLNSVFADHAPAKGVVDVWSIRPGASFVCYGSVIDNGTSDPTTIMPQ